MMEIVSNDRYSSPIRSYGDFGFVYGSCYNNVKKVLYIYITSSSTRIWEMILKEKSGAGRYRARKACIYST